MNSSRKSSLPPHFIGAMRTLFDIMDSEKSGYIRLEDLTSRWERNPPNPDTGIPPGFIACLRRVTPTNGLLTFERFCAGLRLALAEQRLDQQTRAYPHKMPHRHYANPLQQPPLTHKVKSDSSLNVSAAQPPPLNRMSTRRAVEERRRTSGSQPAIHSAATGGQEPIYGNYQLNEDHRTVYQRRQSLHSQSQRRMKPRAPAPPPYGSASSGGVAMPPKPGRRAVPPPPQPTYSVPGLPSGAVPRVVSVPSSSHYSQSSFSQPPSHQASMRGRADSSDTSHYSVTVPTSPRTVDGVRWRDKNGLTVITDGRRHTVGEALEGQKESRQTRLLSEEEELLGRGLSAAAKLSNFLHQRQAALRTRAKLLGKSLLPTDSATAVQEERLNYLRAHVAELARRINALVDASEKGFPAQAGPLHQAQPQPQDQQLEWLKKQNRQLTEEVSQTTAALQAMESERSEMQQRLRLGSKSPSPLSSSTPSPPSNASSGYRSHPGLLSHSASLSSAQPQGPPAALASHYAQPTPLLFAPPPSALRPRHDHQQHSDPLTDLCHDYQATLI